jgi:hypothetical protein
MQDKSKISVAKYFLKTYNLKITDKDQPMLVMTQQGKPIYVPSEFCIMDGVPESIKRNGRDMRVLLGKTRQDPDQKLSSINKMIAKLFKSQKCKQWGITIDTTPLQVQSRMLQAPELIHKEGKEKKIFASERVLKQMPVFSCSNMSEKQIILVYEPYLEKEAQGVYRDL